MSSELPVGYASTDSTDSDPTEQSPPSPHSHREFDDDHDAETLADFGLDLSIEWYNGIVIETQNIDSYIAGWELNEIDPSKHEHIIIQPIGVGPFINHAAHVPGEEPVFVNVYAAREYDFPGESYRLDAPNPETLQLTRRNIDKLAHSKPVVQQLKHGERNAPEHWQNPDDDPDNLVEL
jgi:hypothetical protein